MLRTIVAIIGVGIVMGCQPVPEIIDASQATLIFENQKLKKKGKQCVHALNELRKERVRLQLIGDTLLITGGAISLSSGTTATITEAAMDDDEKSKKAITISTAAIAAGGAFIALLSKTTTSPVSSIEKYTAAARHWEQAQTIIEQYPNLTSNSGDVREACLYRYAVARLNSCMSNDPGNIAVGDPTVCNAENGGLTTTERIEQTEHQETESEGPPSNGE